MPKKQTYMVLNEQPVKWLRAFVCGVLAAAMMMIFVDTFQVMGQTQFSFEMYLGSIIGSSIYPARNWAWGVVANLVFGGLLGILYGYLFEAVVKSSSARMGVLLGFAHAAVAALFLFPVFNAFHEQVGSHYYPSFGFLGVHLGPITPILLILSHLVFGATMGAFYGPIRQHRVRERVFEVSDNEPMDERRRRYAMRVMSEDDDHNERLPAC